MSTRIGVDVGGTFTDLILFDETTGKWSVAKVSTTPADPSQGIAEAMRSGVDDSAMRRADYFLHGTTVGLNALLERRGATVGLLATEGFRDALEIRRGDRVAMYDPLWRPPPPLVPRRLRVPVRGRMLATGEEHAPLQLEDVRAAAAVFAEAGVTAVAISFINSYANGEHELKAAEALREAGFDGDISISHQVSGEYREYERTTTTVIDAFVRARMASYLDRLEETLGERGFDGAALVTRSGGGALTFTEANERPFETIMSGPVAGAEGASELARRLGYEQVITADVGGTSFDTCLISDGRPTLLYEGEIVGMPLQTPWVDVRSIGAGGGSIAFVDEGGLLRVGPASAGADPGPACYGRGGTAPTVTDAAFLLGMLGQGHLAGGLELDRAASEAAIEPLAEALGLDQTQVAGGILKIASANMAGAIREITIERGDDPRQAALMPFGGAGPLFLSLLMDELDMSTCVLPPHAGNFSAWGLLGADLVQSVGRTHIAPLSEEGIERVNATVGELFEHLEQRANHPVEAEPISEIAFDMRYVGQEHSLTVEVGDGDRRVGLSADALRERFRSQYLRTFGLDMEEEVEIASVRATLRTPLPRHEAAVGTSNGASAASREIGSIRAWSFVDGDWAEFALLDRAGLEIGDTFQGPAIVIEPTATSCIDRGLAAEVHESGCVIVTRTPEQ